jgi:hypothetical protein
MKRSEKFARGLRFEVDDGRIMHNVAQGDGKQAAIAGPR